MIDPKMAKRGRIQGIIAGQGITIDNAVGDNLRLNDWQEGLPPRIGNDLGVHSTSPLQQTKDWDFAPSTPTPLPLTASK